METIRELQIEDELRYLAWRRQQCDRPACDRTAQVPAHTDEAVATAGPRPVTIPADTSRLFHLVPASEAEDVIRHGIFAGGDGCIYCFTDAAAAGTVAREQVFARRYAVFEIDLAALNAQVEADVGVWVWEPYMRIVRRPHIDPRHLRLTGVYEITRPPTEADYVRCQRWGWSRQRTAAVFEVSDRFAAGEITVTQVAEALKRIRAADEARPQSNGVAKGRPPEGPPPGAGPGDDPSVARPQREKDRPHRDPPDPAPGARETPRPADRCPA